MIYFLDAVLYPEAVFLSSMLRGVRDIQKKKKKITEIKAS